MRDGGVFGSLLPFPPGDIAVPTVDGDNCAGNGILLRDDILEENLQGFPSATAQIMQKLAIMEKVPTQDLRDAEDEMPVRDTLEYIYAQPFLFSGLELVRK